MSEQHSFSIRIASKHPNDDAMHDRVEEELFQIAHQAVGNVKPGTTIKAQRTQGWVNLGRPPMWRYLSAYYRDGSGNWSAQAVLDFQERFRRWREAQAQRAATQAHTDTLRRAERSRAELEAARHEHRAALTRIERQLAACDDALRLPSPDPNGP